MIKFVKPELGGLVKVIKFILCYLQNVCTNPGTELSYLTHMLM